MKAIISSKKKQIVIVLGIVLFGLIVLWPSFLLHFDGDSYLTLWRYQLTVKQNSSLAFSFLTTFFTDYGPQDSIFAALYSLFGFRPIYFYTISFIIRLVAAFSLYPLLFYLTKNKIAAYFSVTLFLITPVGLETTNWVFNIPSYLAIVFLNMFLLLYLKLLNKIDLAHYFLSLVALFLLIIIQPIRMVFVFPFLMLSALVTLFFKKISIRNSILIHAGYIALFLLIFTFGNIGDSVGVKGTPTEKIRGLWIRNTFVGTGGLSSAIKERNYKAAYYYIGQIGNIVAPNYLVPKETTPNTSVEMAFKYTLPIFIIYCIIVFLVNDFKKYKPFLFFSAFLWTAHIWWTFHYKAQYPVQPHEIFSLIVGGYFILTLIPVFLILRDKQKHIVGLIVGILIIFLSYFIPWVRNPFSTIDTVGRYLIVSAAGLSIVAGLTLSTINKGKIVTIGLVLYIAFCAISSFSYLNDLYRYRGYSVTENIRSSIPKVVEFKQVEKPVMVYLQSDNERQLYHSLYFGFPVMMYYYQDVGNIWNIAYTTNWSEVVSAYQTGEGFRRFGTMPIKPAELKYIYSYKLVNNKIVDTTQQTRDELIKISKP
jgi:hypothetical protein